MLSEAKHLATAEAGGLARSISWCQVGCQILRLRLRMTSHRINLDGQLFYAGIPTLVRFPANVKAGIDKKPAEYSSIRHN